MSLFVSVQVNHSPSFTTDSQLDREVKDALLYDTLVLINLGACDRRKITKDERRRVKDRLQHHSTREARLVPLHPNEWCVKVMNTYDCLCVCVCFVSGVRSYVNARRPQRSRWRDMRPNTWEASRGSTRGREARNTTSTSNTAARFSRRQQHLRPERSVPGTRSKHVHQHRSHVWKIKMRGGDSIENILSAQFDILDT